MSTVGAAASPAAYRWRLPLAARDRHVSPFVPMAPSWRRLIIGCVAGYLVFVGCGGFLHPSTSSAWVFVALTLNLAVASIPLLFYRPTFGWFHPLIFCFLLQLVQTHLPRTPLYVAGLSHHRGLPGWSVDDLTRLLAAELAISALAAACYLAGYFSGISPSPPRLRFTPPVGLRPRVSLIVAFSALVFIVFLAGRGGLAAHLASWSEIGRVASVLGEGYLLKLTRLGSAACLLWFAFDRAAFRQPLFWAASTLSLAINFLGSGSRSIVLIFVIAAVVIWALRRGRVSLRRLLVLALVCLFLIGALGKLRRSTGERRLDLPWIYEKSVQGALSGAVSEMAYRRGWRDSVYTVLAQVPDSVGLLYGRSYLAVAGAFVPRALWPDKPETIGKLAGRTFFGVQAGSPPGAVGEAYWNFHIPGVCVVFFLFGIFHRWLVRSFLAYREQPAAMTALAITLFFLQPTIGGFVEWMYAMASLGVILFLLGGLQLGRRKRRRAAA